MTYLRDLEDVLQLDKKIVEVALAEYDTTELVKAIYIVSPEVIDYFQSVFTSVDFKGRRKEMGIISLEEAIAANTKVIEAINKSIESE